MDNKYRIKGRILDEDKKPLEGLKIKVYDEKGVFLTSASTDKDGKIDFESETQPKFVKVAHKGLILATKVWDIVGTFFDWNDWIICIPPPDEWHLTGIVREKMSGDPLQGLIVEAFDKDGPYTDRLGEDVTDAAGEFNIWFDKTKFERDENTIEKWFGGPYPDVFFEVKTAQGVIIHTSEIDKNVRGTPHDCGLYCLHKGKEYILEIDYVTAVINKIGPVPITDVNGLGFASYGGITDRPFGGNTTINGRIWGAKVNKWRLIYAAGVVDSTDPRISGLDPSASNPLGFNTIAEGINKVWDGPIATWGTGNLEGLHTVILIVWDDNNNEFHDTQIMSLHNEVITPPAQISSPASGATINKANETDIQIQGTASDDHFLSYSLHWAGCSQTELTNMGITYPPAGNKTPVVGGNLGTWDISGLSDGPYFLRLTVHDRTVLNDGAHTRSDYTWHTLNIVSG